MGFRYIRLEVTIIPNGIDFKKYKNSGTSRQKNQTILFIGRLEKRKGVQYLLQAFAELLQRQPQAKLVIIGDGSQRNRLENFAYQVGIDKRIEFLGFVDEATKRRLLHESAVFCSPALYGESFGIVLLEAMASGLPIVAGDNPGYASVLKEKGTLSLVNPKDTIELSRRLELFLTDEEIRRLWRTWAKNYVKQFDYKIIVDEYEKLYKAVLKAK